MSASSLRSPAQYEPLLPASPRLFLASSLYLASHCALNARVSLRGLQNVKSCFGPVKVIMVSDAPGYGQ